MHRSTRAPARWRSSLSLGALVLLMVTHQPLAAWANSAQSTPDRISEELMSRLNQARSAVGRTPLVSALEAERVAQIRALDMAHQGYFAHVSPQGVGPAEVLAEHGISYRAFGENIARADYPLDQVADVIHAGLLASPGHRALMLSATYSRVGIGVVVVDRQTYVAVLFLD